MAPTDTQRDVELVSVPLNDGSRLAIESNDEAGAAEGTDVDPIDGGRAAWRMLVTAFVFESLLWGECFGALSL